MDDVTFNAELEARLAELDGDDTGAASLPALPLRDFWLALGGIALVSVLLAWWGYA